MTREEEYEFPRRRGAKSAWTAERVAELRRRLGLSQAAFAGRMGVRQQTVSEWETGRYSPRGASATLLGMLAEAAAGYDEAGKVEGDERTRREPDSEAGEASGALR